MKIEEKTKHEHGKNPNSRNGFQKGHKMCKGSEKGWFKKGYKQNSKKISIGKRNRTTNGKLVSHVIWCKINNKDSIPEGFVIHHKDFNEGNDDSTNLQLMLRSEHTALHDKLRRIPNGA